MDYSNDRDFIGYGNKKPKFLWPKKSKIAISIVVNIEEGAEQTISSGDEKNEMVYEGANGNLIANIPDLCMESHFEYGTRAGIWRILDLLDKYTMKATMSCCSRAIEKSPWLASEIIKRGHEIAAHSVRWESHASMNKNDEKKIIAKCYDSLKKNVGLGPVGWHTRSATSLYTRKLLVDHGGFLYDSNSYNDDLPQLKNIDGKSFVVLPYSFDTNDMRFESGGFVFGSDFSKYCIDTFDQLYKEGQDSPKMMSVGLHPRIIGRPGRIAGLEFFLEHISNKEKVWVTKRNEIAQFWNDTFKI